MSDRARGDATKVTHLSTELDGAASSNLPTVDERPRPTGEPLRVPDTDPENRAEPKAPLPEPTRTERVLRPLPAMPASIGRYVIQDRLGAGGMAEVFLAREDGRGRSVVIKRSLPHLLETPRFVEMFQREARIAARLDHENVVRLHELGRDGEAWFIAMEHVDGITLHRLARRAWAVALSLPMEAMLCAIVDAARGLAHAHALTDAEGRRVNLVHRDISPDNLIVRKDGVTKVLDFGIAKAADTDTVTRSGEIKGKVPFMSPEQVRGEPVDERSDLYSLGVCLYWLLTGRRPLSGASDFLTLQAVLEEQPAPPSAHNPKVPASLDEVALRLLAKEPQERFPSAGEVVAALEPLVGDGRAQLRDLVREMMALPPVEIDAPPPGGEGFWAATPLSAAPPVVAVPRAEPPRPRAAWLWPSIGGAAAAAGLFALALAFSADGVAEVSAAGPVEVRSPVRAAPAPVPKETPRREKPRREKPGPRAEPAPVATRPEPPREAPKRSAARATRASAPSLRSVALKAPSEVRWKLGGRDLGRGSATVRLPPQARAVTALDGRYGSEHRVPIDDGVADFGALAKGRLDIRVYPYAEVLLGKRTLGTTPLAPTVLTEGRYRVRLRFREREETRSVTVEPGKTASVRVSFDGK